MDRWIIVVLLGTAALGVRTGMAMYAVGLARSKNAASSAIRQVCDFLVSVLAFCLIGSIIVFYKSGSGVMADLGITFHPPADNVDAIFFYAIIFSIASAVVSGVVGERSRFFPMLAVPVILGAIVVPLGAHWGWLGWLKQMKFTDNAGACIIHLAGGASALAAAVLVGPRMGKFNKDGSSNAIPGHNLPLTTAGVAMMFVAWLPYVLGGIAVNGSTLGPQPAMNALLAGCAGGLVALLYSRLRYGKAEILLTFSGLLGGLVAISSCAASVRLPGAILVGGIAGILVPIASVAIDLIGRVDDPTAGISIHGVGGLWGTLAAGIFVSGGIAEKLRAVGVQAIGALVIIAIAGGATLAILAIVRATVGIRSKEADEFDGLDLAEHDINAYPDFQQTMIKSYHLREA
jgi:Amt family ammonium transporter